MTALQKPVRRTTEARVPHGVAPRLVVTLYPGGVVGLREIRRRKEYVVEVGALYARLVAEEARRALPPRRRTR